MTTPKSVPTAQSIDVRIDKIKVGERMRSLDMAKVSELADSITLISPEWGEICSVQKQPNPLLSLSFDDSKGTLAQYRPFEAKSSISCHFRVNFTPNRVKKGMLKNEDVYAARV